MTTVFFTIVGLAALHWIYDGIVAPGLRMGLRFDLFELRDQIRELYDLDEEIDERVLGALQDSVNNAIRLLSLVNLEMVVRAHREFDANPRLRRLIERRQGLLRNCPSKQVQRIQSESEAILTRALGVNSLPLGLYLLPASVTIAIVEWMRHWFQGIIEDLTALPASRANALFPSSEMA